MDAHIPSAPGSAGDGVANAQGRKSSLAGDDSDQLVIQQWQEQAMQPIKEDIVLWLNITLETDSISGDDFMGCLDNGVMLCKLAEKIQEKQQEAITSGSVNEKPVIGKKVKYRSNAAPGTWFARDNTAAFLTWCKEQNIKPECMFETEGLVLHKSERSVILCLLELARLGMKYGLEPPSLIKMEAEIDQMENGSGVFEKEDGDSVDGKKNGGENKENKPAKTVRKAAKNDVVDKKVVEMSSTCKCDQCFQVERISEGRYIIGGRNMFVRLLQDKHLMVRVGGGWDTLEHYLDTHDPCRIIEFKRNGAQPARPAASKAKDADYVQARGRYKSAQQRRKMSSAI